MDLIGRVAFQHLVLRDQTLRAFSEEHLVAELYGCSHLAALDQVGMRFEDGIDLFGVGHLLAVEHAAACLIDDAASQIRIMCDLAADIGDGDIGKHVFATRRAGVLKHNMGTLDNLLGNTDERAVCPDLALLPLPCGHALDLLHPTPSCARAIAKTLETSKVDRFGQVTDRARDHAYHVPDNSESRIIPSRLWPDTDFSFYII